MEIQMVVCGLWQRPLIAIPHSAALRSPLA